MMREDVEQQVDRKPDRRDAVQDVQDTRYQDDRGLPPAIQAFVARLRPGQAAPLSQLLVAYPMFVPQIFAMASPRLGLQTVQAAIAMAQSQNPGAPPVAAAQAPAATPTGGPPTAAPGTQTVPPASSVPSNSPPPSPTAASSRPTAVDTSATGASARSAEPSITDGPSSPPDRVDQNTLGRLLVDRIPRACTAQIDRIGCSDRPCEAETAATSEGKPATGESATTPMAVEGTTSNTPSAGNAFDAPDTTGAASDASAAKDPETVTSAPFLAMVRVTAPDGLRVRRTPDTTSPNNVVGFLRFHDEIGAHARVGEWVAVTYRMMTAYVHGGYLEQTPKAAETAHGQGPAAGDAHAPLAQKARSSQIVASNSAVKAPSVPSAPAQAPRQPPPGATFTTLTGNTLALTSAEETKVLMALRHDERRLDPHWLMRAQAKLGLADATGAFNTETLRAMRTRARQPQLDAHAILHQAFLVSIEPGEPFAQTVDGYGDFSDVDTSAKTPADRAAQAVGYPSYEAYWGILEHGTFLGRSLKQGSSDGRVHSYLAARLRVAEAFLRQRHPGEDEAVIKAINWNGVIGGAYADTEKATHDPKDPKSHMHTMGLAVDVDAGSNPYLFGGDGKKPSAPAKETTANWLAHFYEDTSRVAARVFGGDALTPGSLMETSQRMSTEELHAHVIASSNAFKQYVELSEQPEDVVIKTLVKKGHYSESESRAELARFAEAKKIYHDSKGNRKYHQLTNIDMELVIALRDVAGLAWGGTEMSTIQNGDFMHFDCRNDEFGHAVYSKTTPKGRGPGKKK